jgi:hypothetical protein
MRTHFILGYAHSRLFGTYTRYRPVFVTGLRT